jgi:hypothetical protein
LFFTLRLAEEKSCASRGSRYKVPPVAAVVALGERCALRVVPKWRRRRTSQCIRPAQAWLSSISGVRADDWRRYALFSSTAIAFHNFSSKLCTLVFDLVPYPNEGSIS